MKVSKFKINKNEERAKSKYDVVEACVQHITYKLAEVDVEHANITSSISSLKQEIDTRSKAGESEAVIDRLLGELDLLEINLSTNQWVTKNFIDTRWALVYLKVQIDALRKLGWDKTVVKLVHERNLPEMIKSDRPEDMEKVLKIIKVASEKITDVILRKSANRTEAEKLLKGIEATAKIQAGLNHGTAKQERARRLAEISEEVNKNEETKPVEMAKPIDADVEPLDGAKKYNKID